MYFSFVRAASGPPRRAHHALHFTQQQARALNLRGARHLDRKLHVRDVAPALRLHPGHVHFLAREDFGDIAQQALPIVRFHGEIDWVHRRSASAHYVGGPRGLKHTFR